MPFDITTFPLVKSHLAQDLDAAADYIEKNGWTQYSFRSETGAVCLLGALGMVTNQLVDEDDVHCTRNGVEFLRFVEAQIAITDELLRRNAEEAHSLALWNDRVATEKEEVIAVLRAAASFTRM